MVTEHITSPSNRRIKDLVRLRKRRERDQSQTFVIEGYRELLRADQAGIDVQTVFTCAEFYLGENEPDLIKRFEAKGAEVIETASEPFLKASYRDRPEGLLAVAKQFDTSLDAIALQGSPLLLVAESIEKPGNLGTMLRTAEAAGLTGVVVSDPTTDPFNPNVVRASLGTVFSVPLAIADSREAITILKASGVRIVATTPAGDVPHDQVDLTGACALVVGSEQYGLTDVWLQEAAVQAVIEMPGSVDSLNAAMAAGIVVFEALRQRSERS